MDNAMNKIYVGNLPYNVTEKELEEFFEQYGKISDLHVIRDRETQRSKGFGFVTFETQESAQSALDSNGKELEGRPLKVSEAKERERRPSTGGGAGGGGGRGGNNGGRRRSY